MKTGFVEDMKKKLEYRLAQLLPPGRPAAGPDEDAGENRFSDPLDVAVFYTGQELMFQMMNRRNASVEKIRRALDRIQDGSFGVCDDCGGNISVKRLKVRPHATRCIQCKSYAEELEGAVGF